MSQHATSAAVFAGLITALSPYNSFSLSFSGISRVGVLGKLVGVLTWYGRLY